MVTRYNDDCIHNDGRSTLHAKTIQKQRVNESPFTRKKRIDDQKSRKQSLRSTSLKTKNEFFFERIQL